MSIWELCIKRPIFTVMLVSAPIVLGLASYPRLGVDLFPNVDLPLVTVTTTLRGASVEEMETGVTKPIEEIVNTVSGIEQLRSTTKEGISQITIEFNLDKDGAVAAQEVDAKVRTILSQLPEGTDAPIIDKFALDAAPVLTLAVSGRRDSREITEIAKRRIKEDLESLPGVGAVILVGGRQRAIQISIDTDKLKKFENLTIEDVRQALVRENQEQPGGRIDQGPSEVVLRTMGRVRDPNDFADLIIANRNGHPVRIRDIGSVADSFEEPRGLSRLWTSNVGNSADSAAKSEAPGDAAVSLIVQKQSGTNTVAIVHAVKRRLAELGELLPPDIAVAVIRDQSKFIENSIHEVQVHLLLAAVLVSLTILLFMRDWRTTIIATLSIPTSMIATFAFMYVMGFTLNNITMLGLILAIGIVVDDAVVVHENIFRHMEEYGLSAWNAAASATKEIALAVVATTFSLLVIFIPVVFMGGRVGRFFSSFGYVVGFSILMSMFISFTMTPMLCSRFLKAEEGYNSKAGWIWRLVESFYMLSLRFSLRHRWLIVTLTIGMLASTPTLMSIVGKDFVPRDDTSEFEVAVTLPEGYTLDRADEILTEVDLRLRKLRGVQNTFITIGDTTGRTTRGQGEVTRATIYCKLADLKEREFTQFDVMADARLIVADYPDLRAAVQDVAAISGSGFRQVMIDLNLRGPDMQRLQEFSEQITTWMKTRKHYVDVDTSLSFRKPEIRIMPLRERASELGVSIQSVSSTANVLVGGEPVSKYKEADQQYDVWLRAQHAFRDDPSEIARLTVPSTKPGVGVVELGNVARFEEAQGPGTIERFARQRQVVVSANLEGKPLGEGVQELADFVKTLDLPADYRWEFIGQAKNLNDTMSNFFIAFGLAFLFMYMILAAQFESFVHPITILLALPLTVPFAILSLIMLRTNLDIYAMFGLFMLFGIVKKNGILQVDYTNVLRERGVPRDQAILDANSVRLRPILMTTVMLVAAMVPMALGEGPGAASRAGMAKVILGGQLLSLLLTLLLTPVAYSLWDDLTNITRRWGVRWGWLDEQQADDSAAAADLEQPQLLKIGSERPAPRPVDIAA
jgi:HAE1 family hydrophobic/amphiphilic exporter-1